MYRKSGKLTNTPQQEGPGATHEVHSTDITAESTGVGARLQHENIANVEEGGTAKSEITPFVAGSNESCNETL